jgi:acetyl esterase
MIDSRSLRYALLVSCLPILAWAGQAALPAQPLTIEGATSHVYKTIDGSELRLHVFSPPDQSASAARAAIVFFFGGAWLGGSVERFVPQARYFAQRGMIAVVADYRVYGRHKTSPVEAVTDAKSAVRWMRAHARELAIDPNRIAAAGGSSGGHIALSAAMFERFDEPGEDRQVSSKPNALVLFNPAVDTTSEGLRRRFGERVTEVSPLHHPGSSLPPTIILHGKSDTVVPYADVERFCAQAKSRGLPCELVGYEGVGHGFFNEEKDEHGRWYWETLLEADRFLTKIGYLQGPSPGTMTWTAYSALQRSGRHPAWPYIIRIAPPRGALLYFGAGHSFDPADIQNARIEQEWKAFAADIAFTEGGQPPIASSRDEAVRSAGEPGLVRFLAARDNVPTTTLDPSLAQQLAALSRTFTREQIKVFFVLRAVSQYVARQGNVDLPKETERVLRVFTATPGLSGSPRTVNELAAAYVRLFPEAGGYENVQSAWFDPVASGTFLNDISRELNDYRDEFIVRLIVQHVSEGQRVFAVIGGSHVIMQEAVLRATLARERK